MAKRLKPETTNHQSMVSEKFRTTPMRSTIKRIKGLPKSAILYKCAASANWQFRVFLEGKPRKRTTKRGNARPSSFLPTSGFGKQLRAQGLFGRA